MQRIVQRLSALKNSRLATRILLALFAALAICVIFVGLDNPTGIILGWLATATLITELTRKWRKIRYFLILLFASFIGAIILSFLYVEVAFPLAEWFGGVNASQSTAWRIYHVIVSNIILLFTPVGIVIGIVGAIWLDITRLMALQKRGGTTVFIIIRLFTPIGILFGIAWAIWLIILRLVALRKRSRTGST